MPEGLPAQEQSVELGRMLDGRLAVAEVSMALLALVNEDENFRVLYVNVSSTY